MTRSILITAVVTVLMVSTANGQSPIFFQHVFGTDSTTEYGNSVVEAVDSGYFVAGVRVTMTPSIIGEGLLLRTDKYGNELWTRYYSVPGSNDLTFENLQSTSDGNLLVTGVVSYPGGTLYDSYLAKMDLLGNILWYKTYGGNCRQRAMQAKETFDGGFILGGWNEIQCSAPSISFYLIKTDSNGDTLWTRTYNNGGSQQTGLAVAQTTDSGYVLVGKTDITALIGSYGYIIKTNKYGDTLWTRVMNYQYQGEAHDIVISPNGTLIITGWLAPGGCARPVAAEYDMNGNELWVQGYSSGMFCEWNYSVCKTNDGGYALLGMDNVSDFYLIKANASLNDDWTEKYHQGAADYGYSVQQTMDGGFIMAGITTNTNISDILLIKTDSLGSVVGVNEINPLENLLVYPNPATQYLVISTKKQQLQKLHLFTLDGKQVMDVGATGTTSNLDISALAAGMYVLRATTENGIFTQRVEIIK